MKPSVLMFCPQFRPLVGGSERQAEKLAAALVEAGCRVTILTPRIDPDSPDCEEANGVTIERFPFTDLARRYPVPGVAVLNIPYILWQVARAVWPRLKGADVLHCHLASLQTAGAALAGRIAHVPLLCKAATADHRSDLGEIREDRCHWSTGGLAGPNIYPNLGGHDRRRGGGARSGRRRAQKDRPYPQWRRAAG